MICSRRDYYDFYNKYKNTIGGSVPNSMLQHMYKKLTNDVSKCIDVELDQRILKYCLSKGDKDLWPDLRAVNSGAKTKYDTFFR